MKAAIVDGSLQINVLSSSRICSIDRREAPWVGPGGGEGAAESIWGVGLAPGAVDVAASAGDEDGELLGEALEDVDGDGDGDGVDDGDDEAEAEDEDDEDALGLGLALEDGLELAVGLTLGVGDTLGETDGDGDADGDELGSTIAGKSPNNSLPYRLSWEPNTICPGLGPAANPAGSPEPRPGTVSASRPRTPVGWYTDPSGNSSNP